MAVLLSFIHHIHNGKAQRQQTQKNEECPAAARLGERTVLAHEGSGEINLAIDLFLIIISRHWHSFFS